MDIKTETSIQDMCRTCMIDFSKTKKKFNRKKQNIDEVPTGCKNSTSIRDLLQIVQPQIQVDVYDNLPSVMCSDCIQKLLVSHDFIEMYKNVDEKFHKMLDETEIANKCYDNDIEEPLISIQKGNHAEEDLNKESNLYEITKYELEIEQINIDAYDKEKEVENECPEFEGEVLQNLYEKKEAKEPIFLNPYSDASDNEWLPHSDASDNEWSPRQKDVTRKKTLSLKMFDATTNLTSKKIPRKGILKGKKIIEELPLPVQNSNGSVSCQECEIVFDNMKLWRKHMKQHRAENLPKRKYIKKLNKPIKNQANEQQIKCEHCGKAFARLAYYKTHMRVHTGEQPYLCIECGKGFKNISGLNIHMLRHRGEKTFQCSHCPKKFVCASGLYGHMMVHSKEKPYVCNICGKAFHMAYQLRKHNLYHNNIRNYQCEYCDMKFVTGEKQRRHMRTHTGEKPYRCKYCERAFAQSSDCVKHLRQHLGDNVYQCELCPLRYPLARDLRKHFATHKDDDEETRTRNLEARIEEEKNLQIKLGCKQIQVI